MGTAAGLLAGIVSGSAGAASEVDGMLDLDLSATGLVLHLIISTVAGAVFGAVFRHQPGGYAATISNGLLFSMLLWAIGPLTLMPLLMGDAPTWSAGEAYVAFGTLIDHLLYGGSLGFLFYVSVYLYTSRGDEPEATSEPAHVTRVVILGGGFGGISTAHRLEQLFWRDPSIEITVLSHSNYLLFTPMLAEVAASALEPQHISSPVRASLLHTQFRRCEIGSIDTEAQLVTARDSAMSQTHQMSYDHLVLALGSVPNFFGLPGMEEHAFTLKSLDDATRLRNHVIAQLEHADVNPDSRERRRQLAFVVAGGGFAGTEMIAELFDLVHSVLRYFPNIRPEELRFVLVNSRDRILPEISEGLADYALQKLQRRGIEFVLNARVAGATADAVLVQDAPEIPTRTVVWTAGNQPNPLLATLPCERNRAGAVIAESTLQLKGFTNIWVVGDCGQIPDRDGAPFPPTAQHAIREGKAAAANIASAMEGKPLKPFRFRTLGMLVPLGRRTGVAEIRGLRFSGLLAWLMWRGIYLGLLPGVEKKVRVLFDWLIDLFFPRDIVLTLDVETPTLSEMMEADPGPRPPEPEPRGTTDA